MELYVENEMEPVKDFAQVVCVQENGEGNYNAAAYEDSFPNFISLYKEHLATVLRGNFTVRSRRHCFFTDNGTVRPFRYKHGEGTLYHLFVGGKISSNMNSEDIKTEYLDDLHESMLMCDKVTQEFNRHPPTIP